MAFQDQTNLSLDAETACPFASLTVVGLGLLGGSFAMATRSRFPNLPILAIDANFQTRAFAVKHQVADVCFVTLDDARAELEDRWSSPVQSTDSELSNNHPPHLLLLACHLEQNLSILESLALSMQGRAVIGSDIGSCKRAISAKAQALNLSRFIPGHPMAGKAVSGVENATDLLFANKGYLLCPLPENNADDVARLETFIHTIGALPRHLSAEEHDRAMAYVSHLPQVYATLLANLLSANKPESLLRCYGGGLDDQLRLAASPYTMWGDVLQQNQDNVKEALTGLRDLIDQALAADDPAAMWQQRFSHANAIEKAFQEAKKTGAFSAPVIESAS